ncbi:Oxysterol-binding protein [Besnoitia besnoiti]|uniref:Oxysterol-binding protein n=1 Tax=Besnoitia besnoiti TaxID=94643 RepID=A0A2A9MFC6_BESBE|nr:Oxysterol-binding protein [Besnoitia besnoiti]PFH36619.1 Oxysterol-binding protein [Besnoitia besnoiti]
MEHDSWLSASRPELSLSPPAASSKGGALRGQASALWRPQTPPSPARPDAPETGTAAPCCPSSSGSASQSSAPPQSSSPTHAASSLQPPSPSSPRAASPPQPSPLSSVMRAPASPSSSASPTPPSAAMAAEALTATPLTSAFIADTRRQHSMSMTGPRSSRLLRASSSSSSPSRSATSSSSPPRRGPSGTQAGQRPAGSQTLARRADGSSLARSGSHALPHSSSKFLNSVIQQGWLQKWTNLVSSWRPRYFYVMPGLFKYSVQKNAPPKEVFMLNQCVIRLCPHDPVRFEVEVVDQQTLYLRTETLEEKQLWYAAFKQAQRALLNCTRNPSFPLSSLSSSSFAAADKSEKAGSRPSRDGPGPPDRATAGPPHERKARPSDGSLPASSPDSAPSTAALPVSSATSSPPSSSRPAGTSSVSVSSQELSPSGSSSFLSSSTSSMAGALAGAVASGVNYAAAYASSKLRGSLLASSPSSSSLSIAPPGSSSAEGLGALGATTAGGAAAAPKEPGAGGGATATGAASPSSPQSAGGSSASLEWLGKEGSPLVLLLENVIASRQQVQATSAEIRALQAGALKEVGAILSNANGPGAHELKRQLVALLQKIDSLQLTVERHFSTTEALLAEENSQRRQLEKSLRSMAKQNYKLEKTQQRILALGTLPEGAQSAGGGMAAAGGSALATGAGAPAGRGGEGLGRRAGPGGVLETDHQLSSSSGEEDDEDDDVEFFECEDQEAYPAPEDLPPPPAVPQRPEEPAATSSAVAASAAAGAEGAQGRVKKEKAPETSLLPVASPACYALSLLFPSEHPPVLKFLEATAGRLGGAMPHRRTALAKPRTEFKVGLWSILKDCIGKDLSRISMPVYFNEPTSFLQRLLEDFQYADIVHAAPLFPDSVDRMLLVTLFAITPYASATGRTYKPFNPLLGETFEFTHRGYNFIAEQVGHHPPRTAYHVSNDRFLCWGDVAVRNRFTGKSLEVTTPGTVHLVLPAVDDHYTYRRVKLLVHNVIWGKLWAELDGTTLIQNQTKGDYSIIQFLRKGWLDKAIHMIRAIVFTAEGRPIYRLSGSWSHALYVEEYRQSRLPPNAPKPVPASSMKEYWRSEGPPPSDSPDNKLQQLVQGFWETIPVIEGSRRLIWRPAVRPAHSDAYYGFGNLTMELNELTDEYDPAKGAVIAPTDSRFRPDQKLYEEGRVEEAVEEKTRLEEKQRSAARLRPRGEEDYDPLWFSKGQDTITHEPAWLYKGGYWEAKSEGGYPDSPDIF